MSEFEDRRACHGRGALLVVICAPNRLQFPRWSKPYAANELLLCRSGRQPDPLTTSYDALLFSLQLAMPREAQTLWGMLRSLLQQPSLVCCGPWVKRRRVHKYQGNASLCQSVPLVKGQHSDKPSTERSSAWLRRMFGRVRAD